MRSLKNLLNFVFLALFAVPIGFLRLETTLSDKVLERPMALFDNKVVIVTGGNSGIGEAACHLYACEGVEEITSEIAENGVER